jgi:hypothetical protein
LKTLFFWLALNGITSADAEQIRTLIYREIDASRLCERPVHQPAAVSFLELLIMSRDVVQPVRVTERSGAVWVAYYALQRQTDGTWHTQGCRLVQPGRTISA